jgi:hypothetical protein
VDGCFIHSRTRGVEPAGVASRESGGNHHLRRRRRQQRPDRAGHAQGIDSWVSNWRAIFGPKGMTPSQVAFWEEALAKMAATEEWKKQLELQQWDGHFMRSREFTRYLETEYAATRTIMAELGLAK